MHGHTDATERLAEKILAYAEDRFRLDPVPLDGPRSPEDLARDAGQTITAEGLGGEAVLDLFDRVLSRACISIDHPRFLSFIPPAPTEAATLFDLVVGASSIYGGSWLEGAGAVYAENQALRWIADLAGLPAGAGGVFVQGGTIGNVSALVAARHAASAREGARPTRWKVAATSHAHSSVKMAARVMDVDVVEVESDADGRLRGDLLREALERDGEGVFAVVATSGSTNFGTVDRLDEVADVCAENGLWFHVDGAYGGAALAAPTARPLFTGIERADSFTVDPHKWLFAPFDCCALLYREPELARAAHTQTAGYLEPLQGGEWNPSDYAINLTRRPRGLPFWFSLAAHGTAAYSEAIEHTLAIARYAASAISARAYLELLREPDLSVVVFRRLGWDPADYYDWSERLLNANFAFVTPSTHAGETITRFAITNPRTTENDISTILDTLA
jgi:L-2,4-diaminobutyrate decarboxylase